jgi:hypothetical protein
VPALVGLAVREWLAGGRDDDERDDEDAGRDSAGREPANLNVLSRPSGNLQHHKRLPLARPKVWNRSSERNEQTKPHGGSELRARP